MYNTPQPEHFYARRELLNRKLKVPIEIIYAASWMQRDLGQKGIVQASPIDLDRFKPNADASERKLFTVGRLSRDIAKKHHPGDLAFYQRIADQGAEVRVMGGICLREQGRPASSVALLPEGAEPPEVFLRSLDSFFYRTDDTWYEPHGWVVQEAMACGLPVVCSNRGGYVNYIRQGENGFLFNEESEAFDILTELQRNVSLRRRVGDAARKTMQELFSAEALKKMVDFYLYGEC